MLVLLVSARPAAAQARIWREDDRITITNFSEVYALAFDGRRVYAATTNGLELYDAVARRWLAPSTLEDGYPLFERPIAIAYDRGQGGLWLQTTVGNLYLWSELNGRWDLRLPDSAPAELFRSSQVPNSDPAWRVLRGVVSLDPHGRRWPLTGVIPADRPGTYWVGTAGGNLLLADARSLSAEWLPFGTLARGIQSLAADRDGGIWFGGNGLGPRDGITRTDSALQTWTSYESFAARAPRRAIHQILPGDTTWVAAADGLYMLLPGARAWQRIDDDATLPSANVRTVARTTAGVWAGTQRGLSLIDPSAHRPIWRGMEGVQIRRLAVKDDTVWVASDAGLWRAVVDGDEVRVLVAPDADQLPVLRQRVVSVARAGRFLAVLAADGVYLYDGKWSDRAGDAVLPGSRMHELRGDDNGLLVLGSRGVVEWNLPADTWTQLGVPADIQEGPVTDAIRTGDFLWVATPAGAVRLQWR